MLALNMKVSPAQSLTVILSCMTVWTPGMLPAAIITYLAWQTTTVSCTQHQHQDDVSSTLDTLVISYL